MNDCVIHYNIYNFVICSGQNHGQDRYVDRRSIRTNSSRDGGYQREVYLQERRIVMHERNVYMEVNPIFFIILSSLF